ncbi:aa3-type cytochrome c oxidase subunit IV [Sphingosinithalassobacter portus]|uniref:aa3-type cytochrome c oxidase subunit IV n=1 Tax=Stakelama portus TaxID=2676234 RepID=UPI0023D7CF1A|nr:aa3-type cytochrome c oxidase subunit IV [Sphingosinithalassobacter portus]
MFGRNLPVKETAILAHRGTAAMGDNAEIQVHQNTFNGFMSMVKIGTVAVAIIVAGVVMLIAS